MRNRLPLISYSRTMPRALWWPYGGRLFLRSEVPLYLYPRGQDSGTWRTGRVQMKCLGRTRRDQLKTFCLRLLGDI